MKCEKCGFDFEENKIQVSHDIPKYMGGKDKDGRHNLCESCHRDYESQVLKLALMNLISILPEEQKQRCREAANLAKGFYFREAQE